MAKKQKQEGYYASILRRDPAARSKWSVFWLYPSAIAMRRYRLSHFLWTKLHWKFLAELVMQKTKRKTGIEIHPACTIGRNLFIDHGGNVVIGETTVIGDDCTIFHGVTLGGTSQEKTKRHPTIGNRVVIGTGAILLGPIHVGDDAKIAPNTVIRHDINEKEIAFSDECHVYPRHPKLKGTDHEKDKQ